MEDRKEEPLIEKKDEIISVDTNKKQQDSNQVIEEKPMQEMTITSNFTKCSDLLKKAFEKDEEMVQFSCKVKTDAVYKWNVYHTFKEIKQNFKDIYQELTLKNYIFKPALEKIFKEIEGYDLEGIKTHIEEINRYYLDFFFNETLKKTIKLCEFFAISKNSFIIYNAGRKPMEGYAYKKADPRCCRRVFGCICKCVECCLFPQYNKRWIVLKDDMIYYSDSSICDGGTNVYWFDDGVKVTKEGKDSVTLRNVSRVLSIRFQNEFECELWYSEIMKRVDVFKSVMKKNKFGAYTNKKKYNIAKWFVDGENYFSDLFEHLMKAKESIFITDWWLSPEVFLKRPVDYGEYAAMKVQNKKAKTYEPYSRLMDVLNQAAERGVEVYIQVYCEMSLALTLNSKHSKQAIVQLNPKIKVTRHPKNSLDLLWSHHEKLVIIDQQISYVGGLDLCWGRFDTNEHPLYEPTNKDNKYMFPGIDYSNARICDFVNVEDYLKESVPRDTTCRMPWHDVHIRLEGPVVADIARHFVERWNFSKFDERSGAIVAVKQNASVNRINFGGKKKGNGKSNIPWLGKFIDEQAEKEKKEKREKKEKNTIRKPGLLKSKRPMKKDINKEEKDEEINTSLKKEGILKSSIPHIEANLNKDDEKNEDALLINGENEENILEDEDHLKKKPGEEKPKSNFYNSLINKMSQYKKKAKWFSKEQKKLTTRIKFGFFKTGPRSTVQVLRSSSMWSVGITKPEHSILNAYYKLIDKAKHYIYIENQFFVSKSYTNEELEQSGANVSRIVQNEIALHIRQRIEKAYEKKENFHVFVFIPLLPGFAGEPESSSTLQIILKHTMAGISHNSGLSIFEKLYEKMGEKAHDYISFYSLRGHTIIDNIPITELIYIHSKLMIIDDRKVLIGSANINDRSMLGTRDSEFAVIVKEEKLLDSTMDGKNYKAAKFAASFRKALMAEHLGLKKDDPILIDPVSPQLVGRINTTAKNNTLLYRDIFGCYPDDTYTNFKLLKKYKKAETPQEIKELQFKYHDKKDSIIGHIVEFPLDFLKEENLGINFFSVENLIPERNFT